MIRLDQITLRQLRALDTVARVGTISAAAERLNLTGPAVHSQLKTLEDIMGAPLLHREGADRNKPTPEGDALLVAYREVRASLERAVHTINALGQGLAGSVVLGVVSTGKYFAPRIVARIREELPDIEVILKVGNREAILQALRRGEFDLCIMGRPPREAMSQSAPLHDHPHVIIAAADHPLVGREQVSASDLFRERFVVREQGSGTRILATRYLDEIGAGRDATMIEMSSNETIKQAVMHGLGIALISGHTVAEELAGGRLAMLRCPHTPIIRTWYLIRPAPERHAPAVHKVAQWIADHSSEVFPELNLTPEPAGIRALQG